MSFFNRKTKVSISIQLVNSNNCPIGAAIYTGQVKESLLSRTTFVIARIIDGILLDSEIKFRKSLLEYRRYSAHIVLRPTDYELLPPSL